MKTNTISVKIVQNKDTYYHEVYHLQRKKVDDKLKTEHELLFVVSEHVIEILFPEYDTKLQEPQYFLLTTKEN